MDGIQLASQGIGKGFINLVPGKNFIGGNMKCMTKGLCVSQQAGKALCKILCVCNGPQGSSIAMDNDFSSFFHTSRQRIISPAADNGQYSIVGKGWTDNGDWKTIFPVQFLQKQF